MKHHFTIVSIVAFFILTRCNPNNDEENNSTDQKDNSTILKYVDIPYSFKKIDKKIDLDELSKSKYNDVDIINLNKAILLPRKRISNNKRYKKNMYKKKTRTKIHEMLYKFSTNKINIKNLNSYLIKTGQKKILQTMYNDIYLNSRTENEKYLQELNLIIKMLLEKTLNFFNKPFKVYYENVTKMDLDYSEYYSFVECIIYYSDKTAPEFLIGTLRNNFE